MTLREYALNLQWFLSEHPEYAELEAVKITRQCREGIEFAPARGPNHYGLRLYDEFRHDKIRRYPTVKEVVVL